MVLALLGARFTCVDDPNSTGPVGVRDHDKSPGRRSTNTEEPPLADRVVRIGDGHLERIAEHGDGFGEIDAVFLGVYSRLDEIPPEFHD